MTVSISKQINPYIIGRPIYEPEHFFGRNDLFAFIQDNLSQKTKVILLHGQRRIGKSSVLSQVPNFVKLDNFVFVILSLEGKSKKSLNDVLYELAKEIKSYLEEELEFSVQNIEVAKREVFQEDRDIFTRDFLPQVYKVLGNKNLVLLFDEFDVLEDGAKDAAIDHFFPYLRSIIDKQNRLYIIPVVGRRLDDIPSLLQLFHEAPHQEIGLLRRENAEKLILEPAKGILKYEEDAIDAILELTSGHPYFTQVVCFALFSKAREDERTIITREDVEGIVDRAIELGEGGLTWFRDGLRIPERVVLLAAASVQTPKNLIKQGDPFILLQQYGVFLTPELLDAEENLIEWGFLHELDKDIYRISIRIVRQWFSKRFVLNQEIKELEKMSIAADSMYHEAAQLQKENLESSSIQLFEKVLEKNPNHFSTISNLAKIYSGFFEYKKAKKMYEILYKLDPLLYKENFIFSLAQSGKIHILDADFKNARYDIEIIAEITEKNTQVYSRISRSLTRRRLLEAQDNKEQYINLEKLLYNYLFFTHEDLEYFEAQYGFWVHYQKNLDRYTQEILGAKYREQTIGLETRNKLYQLQQKLGLKDEDAKKLRQRFIAQIEEKIEKSEEIYRQEFEKSIHNGDISLLDRRIMNLRRQELDLIEIEAKNIEKEILEPYQDLRRRIKEYTDVAYELMRDEYYSNSIFYRLFYIYLTLIKLNYNTMATEKSRLKNKLNKIQYMLCLDKELVDKIDRETGKKILREYINSSETFKVLMFIFSLSFLFTLFALSNLIINSN